VEVIRGGWYGSDSDGGDAAREVVNKERTKRAREEGQWE
jgi:hypothetical protein